LGVSPDFLFNLDQAIKLEGNSVGFVDIPRLASRFVADHEDTVVAITFSGMNLAGTVDDEPLFVRALVDGNEALPGAINFTAGFDSTRLASQSFVFTATVDAGIHIVQMQWSSEAATAYSWLRNASLLIAVDSQNNAAQRVGTKAEKLRTPAIKQDGLWTAIPNARIDFTVPSNGEVALTFSSVLKMDQGDFILVRAVIDDGVIQALPAQATLAGRAYHYEARSVTFTANDVKSGKHKVRFEWRSSITEVVAGATLEAWSVTALTGPRQSNGGFFDCVPQNAYAGTESSTFEPVPSLSTNVSVDELSDVSMTFSASFAGTGVILATVTKDGVAASEQEAILHAPTIRFESPESNHPIVYDAGAQSYTFALKDLAPRDEPYQIGVAFRVVQAGVSTPASGMVSDGTLTVLQKRRIGPDLAVGANMGLASKKRESIIEPVYGTRKVLAIVFDPGRSDAPQPSRSFVAGIDRTLFGEAPSTADYYRVVSGGRFNLEKVAVLGPYRGDKAGGDTSTNHYWDRPAHDHNGDGNDGGNDVCDSDDEFKSPFAEQQAEAILKASAEFDFSQYDLDHDGVVRPNELGIIVITPQNTATGSNTNTTFAPYCDDIPFVVNGVEIHSVLHWYTPGTGDGSDPSVELDSAMVAAHEMAHLFLGLDDAYGPYNGIFQNGQVLPCPDGGDPSCQTRYVNTAPHVLSMMTYKTILSSPHLDGFHKLQLGWARPRVIVEADDYSLLDIRQSGEVFILPRRGTDGREYILLETRFETSSVNDPLYDYSLGDSGLAVYHVIEPNISCQAQGGASAPDCLSLVKPMCISSDTLWDGYTSNFVRAGLRLIQPDLVHHYDGSYTDFGELLFGTGLGQDLLDEPAGGEVVCPAQIGDPLPPGGTALLLWVDGNASGYRLKAITTDYTAKKTLFKVEINGQ
jgi:M6 family metalloprotease-like protein